jgi:hypothetical protein
MVDEVEMEGPPRGDASGPSTEEVKAEKHLTNNKISGTAPENKGILARAALRRNRTATTRRYRSRFWN